MNKIITSDWKKNIKEHTERYIEIFRFFYSVFSLSRTLWGKMSKQIIEKLEIVNKKALSCWINLQLSMKLVKIYGIEDHLSYQIIKIQWNRIFYWNFIEKSHQFWMINEKKANIREIE